MKVYTDAIHPFLEYMIPGQFSDYAVVLELHRPWDNDASFDALAEILTRTASRTSLVVLAYRGFVTNRQSSLSRRAMKEAKLMLYRAQATNVHDRFMVVEDCAMMLAREREPREDTLTVLYATGKADDLVHHLVSAKRYTLRSILARNPVQKPCNTDKIWQRMFDSFLLEPLVTPPMPLHRLRLP